MSWEVEVRIDGEQVLTIGSSGYLSGDPDIQKHADIVRECANHLSSFIGTGEISPCFYCGGSGEIVIDNNGPINDCPICNPS